MKDVNRSSRLGTVISIKDLVVIEATGQQLLRFTLQTIYKKRDTNGRVIEAIPTNHRIVAFGGKAEYLHARLSRGDRLYVEGPSTPVTYTGTNNTQIQYDEITVLDFHFVEDNKETLNEQYPTSYSTSI